MSNAVEIKRTGELERRQKILEVGGFSSPLPPPEIVEYYERILPGTTDRILKLAERNNELRWVESADVRSKAHNVARWGQIFAFFIALAGIAGAIALGLKGHQGASAALSISSLAFLVHPFLPSRSKD